MTDDSQIEYELPKNTLVADITTLRNRLSKIGWALQLSATHNAGSSIRIEGPHARSFEAIGFVRKQFRGASLIRGRSRLQTKRAFARSEA